MHADIKHLRAWAQHARDADLRENSASGVGEHLVCSPCVSGVDAGGQVGNFPSAYGGAAVALASVTWIIPRRRIEDVFL